MTGSPLDLARAPVIAPAPELRHLPALIMVGTPTRADPWEAQPTAVRVADVQAGYRTVRLAVRHGERRATVDLVAEQLRELAEHLHDCADLIDPPKET